ncbi:MAG TPA: response regulator transcription factor, partial [Phenylobacterium sp.]|nr:response regulator transcription factor [Phenylobacterium sp.]
MTALLVDDHPLFREGFAAMLRHHRPDWTLRSVNTAAEALAMLDEDRPDLAIIDIQLPDIDGFDAARAIGERAPLVSRVMISGREDGAARLRSRDCGASGFISKAWSPERIIEMLEQVLAGGAAFDTPVGAG